MNGTAAEDASSHKEPLSTPEPCVCDCSPHLCRRPGGKQLVSVLAVPASFLKWYVHPWPRVTLAVAAKDGQCWALPLGRGENEAAGEARAEPRVIPGLPRCCCISTAHEAEGTPVWAASQGVGMALNPQLHTGWEVNRMRAGEREDAFFQKRKGTRVLLSTPVCLLLCPRVLPKSMYHQAPAWRTQTHMKWPSGSLDPSERPSPAEVSPQPNARLSWGGTGWLCNQL